MVHPLKNVLNRLRWDPKEDAMNYRITYRHRGAPNNVKNLNASQMITLGKSYFTVSGDIATGEESVIPFHRILEICNLKQDKVIWKKRERKL